MNPGEAPGKFLVNGEEGYMRPVISHDLAARCGAFHTITRTPLHHCAVCTQFLHQHRLYSPR